MKYLLLILSLCLVPFSASFADDTQQSHAIQLVDKAIAHYKEVGFDQAKISFNDKQGNFVDGQWYVIIFTKDGIFKTHAHNQKLIDNPRLPTLKDVNGRVILDEMVSAGVNNSEGGWAEYIWSNPETKKLSTKKTFVREHDGYLFGVGYYE